jgi:putative pyruvate formate lyase activating enzyme
MNTVDLAAEPISISVYRTPDVPVVSFSDLPEQILPALRATFGAEFIAQSLVPSDAERAFYERLRPVARGRAGYLNLLDSGELERRAQSLLERGASRTVSYFMAAINRSDEAILGRTGVLYCVCRKGCHACPYRGFAERELDAEGVAERMLAMQEAGADNIQWLSPTAYTDVLVRALFLAARNGLHIPLVHKSEGEDSLEMLQMLDGLVDVYLPDVKFVHKEFAHRVGLPASYADRMPRSVREMFRQVGPLARRDDAPLHARGLLVRHLVLPGGLSEARSVLEFVRELDPGIPVHLMGQYEPLQGAQQLPGLNRKLNDDELAQLETLPAEANTLAYLD